MAQTSSSRLVRFCCTHSRAIGEDPVGSAAKFDAFLLISHRLPFPRTPWADGGAVPEGVLDALERAEETGRILRPLLIAGEKRDERPGWRRVIFFGRPARPFAVYDKRDYWIPEDHLADLVIALLESPDQLSAFEPYREASDNLREMLVCTHGTHDAACATFGYPVYRLLRERYGANPDSGIRTWRCTHIGGHEFAGTLIDLPTGTLWGFLEPDDLEIVVHRIEPAARARSIFRGWSGMGFFEQIADREALAAMGWGWLSYCRQGEVLALYPPNSDQPLDNTSGLSNENPFEEGAFSTQVERAEVRINYWSDDGAVSGSWDATIKLSRMIEKQWHSDDCQTTQFPQYEVVHFEHVKLSGANLEDLDGGLVVGQY